MVYLERTMANLIETVFTDVYGAFGLSAADFFALRCVNRAAAAVPLDIGASNELFYARFRQYDIASIDMTDRYFVVKTGHANDGGKVYDRLHAANGKLPAIVFTGNNVSTCDSPRHRKLADMLGISYFLVDKYRITWPRDPIPYRIIGRHGRNYSDIRDINVNLGAIVVTDRPDEMITIAQKSIITGEIELYTKYAQKYTYTYIFNDVLYGSYSSIVDIYNANRLLARSLTIVHVGFQQG